MEKIDWDKAPEGATHYRPGCHRYIPHWVKVEGEYRYMSRLERPDAFIHDHTPRPLSECIPRPSPAWSGEGLPPVGVAIEVKHKNAKPNWARPSFYETKIVAIGKQLVIFKEDGCGHEKVGAISDYIFRPIRTPEQIAADERSEYCDRMFGVILDNVPQERRNNGSDIVEALYDAGLRFQS